MKALFTGKDLELIESLEYCSELEPGYCHIKCCLAWDDEIVDGLSKAGYENLCDLLIARSFIHKGVPFSAHRLDPTYFERIWNSALNQGFKWPGFNRLTLSEKDKAFYQRMRDQTGDILS